MFKASSPQRSLLESEFLISAEKSSRLANSWAEPFRRRILPLIDEEVFRDAFSERTGRPNKPVRLLVAVHLLKEWHDLTDEQVIDQVEFNLQWHHALGIESGTAHVCQKTLHNFRSKLMANDRAQRVFEQVTHGVAEADGLDLGRQRLDSTHVLSNIAVLTRLGLFVETVTHFLKELRREHPSACASLEGGYGRRYLEREGYFSDAKREQARRRLPVVAQDVYALVRAFEDDEAVASLSAFALLKRLFEEQCEVVEDAGGDDAGAAGGGAGHVEVRAPKTVASDSLQSPHDPDATYGHKGKGYEVQVSESCSDDNPYQVITGTSVNGAHESDQRAVLPMLGQLSDAQMLPEELLADTGYGSGANIVSSAFLEVDLVAPVPDPDAPPATEHFTAPVFEEAQACGQAEPASESAAPTQTASQPEEIEGLWEFSWDPTFHSIASCPAGAAPKHQHVAGGQLLVVFSADRCQGCPLAATCPTRQLSSGDRQLRRAVATIATEVRQAEQQIPYFKNRYRKRSGIESTNHELKGLHGLGDLRIRGKPRVVLAVTLKSLALNAKRVVQWHVSQMVQPDCCPCPV